LSVTGLVLSPVTPVSSTNKTDRYDITEILLKVVLKTKSRNFASNIIKNIGHVYNTVTQHGQNF